MPEELVTESLVLRKARDEDLEAIWHNVWRDRALAETMLWRPTRTRRQAAERLERTKRYQAENLAWFVCLRSSGEPIGFAGLREIGEGEYEESGICIARRFQQKGYGRQVLEALVDLVFNRLNGHLFRYGCFRENEASKALALSCGFVYSHSETLVREWDGHEYLCDFYQLTEKQ